MKQIPLSMKQAANLERVWALEAELVAVEAEIAQRTRGLLDRKLTLVEGISAIEANVPDSYDDEFRAQDSAHYVETYGRFQGRNERYVEEQRVHEQIKLLSLRAFAHAEHRDECRALLK